MPKSRTRLTVALVSAVVIALELVLMRVLSIRFWDHLSYLVISTALLGFGASGTLLTLFRRFIRPRLRGFFFAMTMLFAAAIPLAARLAEMIPLDVQYLAWSLREQVIYLVLLELVFFVPLLLAGCVVGAVLMDRPERISGHYAANLIGSGFGALGGIVLLQWLSTPECVSALAGAAGFAGLLSAPWRRWGGPVGTVLAGGALVAVHLLWPWAPCLGKDKDLYQFKQREGTATICRSEGPLGRLEVVAGPEIHPSPPVSLGSEVPPLAAMITIDGQTVGAVYPGGKAEDFAFLDRTTAALPYVLLKQPSVLVLGAGGGSDIGLALYHKSRRVVAAEANRQIIEAMTGPLRDRGGGVYLHPNVEVLNRQPRGYLAERGENFDLIQLPAPESSAAGAAGVHAGHQSYLYTVEAFEQMLGRLTPNGIICVTCWARTPPRDGLRLVAIADDALRRSKKTPFRHLVMIRNQDRVLSLMISNSPLTDPALDAVAQFCEQRGFDMCLRPGITSDDVNRFHQLQQPLYYQTASIMLGPERFELLSNYIYDVRPTTDDRPYFFHFFRLRAWPVLQEQLRGLSRAYLQLGYLLILAVLVQSVPLSAVLILLPLGGRARVLRRSKGKFQALAYFLLIGLGFMFLEMNFLHRLTLYLADPIYSAAVVIGAFLVFGGVGSQLSQRWRRPPEEVVRRAGVVVVAIAVLYLLTVSYVTAATQSWPVWGRAALAVALIAPLAAAMGHMFPAALRRLGATRPAMVPWCWAVNGFASVVATIGAALLAMEIGFTVVAAAGAGAYALAVAITRKPPPEEDDNGRPRRSRLL